MKTALLSSTEPSANHKQMIEDILGLIGNLDTLRGVICFIVLFLLFLVSVVTFRRRVNAVSLRQLAVFKRNKKYIPELFTELNDNLENLRYFVFSNRWKRRIIKEYNRQFSNSQGKEIARILSNQALTQRLPYRTSVKDLMIAIERRRSFFEQLNKDKQVNREKYGEKFFFIREYTYYIPAKLTVLYERCELIRTKSLIIVGSAGNGKTNILCSIVENVIRNNTPCLFVNSRDVDCDCVDYIVNRLVPEKLLRVKHLFLMVVSSLLLVLNKYLFIVIDAINENDSEQFACSIGEMMDKLAKYKRIKIICSCRSEYFEVRHKRFFDKCVATPYIFTLDQVDYDDNAKEKMILLYQKHYDVKVSLSANVRDRLMHSLLLMRLFFEVNAGRHSDNLELSDAEIYKAYFEKVTRDMEPFDFQSKVNNLARLMVERKCFKEIKLDDLVLSTEDQARFKSLLDENLVISRTMLEGKGITERPVEYVYFVFDELRDFCIARYLLTREEEKNDGTYSGFFSFADELYTQRLSPLEGILKYAYYYFKKCCRIDLCQALLDKFSEFVPNDDERNWWDRQMQNVFSNFGLSLVFQAASDLLDHELEYLVKCIVEDSSTFWDVYRFLLRNEYAGATPDTRLTTALILEKIPYAEMKKIAEDFFADRDKRYYYTNHMRAIDNLCRAIEQFMKSKGGLPMHMKTFLVILAALEPYESALNEYKEYVDETIKFAENKTCNTELMEEIMKLKKSRDMIKAFSKEAFLVVIDGGKQWNEK